MAETIGIAQMDTKIPELSKQEIAEGLAQAIASKKSRSPKLLHRPGDEFNRAFNFMMPDSYMQPHLHPGKEKIERIHLVEGSVVVLFFNDQGVVKQCVRLEKGGIELVEVPAFVWHTYVILSDYAISYETMMGVYEPETWKTFAVWAPQEGSVESVEYLNFLQGKAAKCAS